jgi:RNA polymerase sigma factor (sigma-70 family)
MPVAYDERQRRWPVLLTHREQLLRIARARTLSPDDAEDCVQEALTRAAEHPGLDLERAGAFLTTVTIRLTTDLYRAQSRQARLMARVEGLGTLTHDHVEDIADRSLARWLAEQATGLTGQEQAVLQARVTGDSSREAALALGISIRAAESSLTRVRAKLQTAWARVAVVVVALVATVRRHAVLTVPLTAVAASATLGPILLLPGSSRLVPLHAEQQQVVAARPTMVAHSLVHHIVAPAAPPRPAPHPRARVVAATATPAPSHEWWYRPPRDGDCTSEGCKEGPTPNFVEDTVGRVFGHLSPTDQ